MRKFTEILSVLLALTVAFAAFCPCIAAAAEERHVPTVIVPGFMSGEYDLYIDKDDPSKGVAWPPSGDVILDVVKKSIPALTKYMFDRDADKLCDVIDPLAATIFENAVLDPDGNPKGNSGVIFEYPEEITEDTKLYFKYDWRIDPLEIAGQLNDFIEYIVEKTGSEKVAIYCESLGGVITLSYIALYGDARIKNVVFNSTAVYGVNYAGPLFSGKINLSSDAIVNYMKFVFSENDAEVLLNSIFAMLDKVGLLDFVCNIGNKLLEDISPRAVPEVIAPLFTGWLTVWAMVSDEYIDDAMKYVFEDCYKNDGSHDGLKAKVEAYNNIVRPNREKLLNTLNDHANMYVLATYGWSSLPMTPDYNRLGDAVIDLKAASFGATCADYGEQLDVPSSEFVSPDRCVDASTCLFPEQTWILKGFPHCSKNDGMWAFMDMLLASEEQITVDTYEEYPRFMIKDGEDIKPFTDEAVTAKTGFFDKLKEFFNRIFESLSKLFKK